MPSRPTWPTQRSKPWKRLYLYLNRRPDLISTGPSRVDSTRKAPRGVPRGRGRRPNLTSAAPHPIRHSSFVKRERGVRGAGGALRIIGTPSPKYALGYAPLQRTHKTVKNSYAPPLRRPGSRMAEVPCRRGRGGCSAALPLSSRRRRYSHTRALTRTNHTRTFTSLPKPPLALRDGLGAAGRRTRAMLRLASDAPRDDESHREL